MGPSYYGVTRPDDLGVNAGFAVKPSGLICSVTVIIDQVELNFSTYPNPANETIMVSGNFSNETSISIRNVFGQKVMNQFSKPAQTLANTLALGSDTYITTNH